MKHEASPVPAGAVIRQGGRTCLHRLTNTTPVLIHVRSGNKVVVTRDTHLFLTAGEYGLLPDHQPMTMENIPRAPLKYEARVLPVPRPLFEEAYARLAFITPRRMALPIKAMDLPAEAAGLFDFCCSSEEFAKLPGPVATIRLIELIIWFALSGAILGTPGNPLLQHRLRQMIEADTARNWTLGHAARSFNMSEATLRRKLAAESTSFSETLSDTRMTRALAFLQTTTLPIAHVAQEVGYDSPSQFSARFKERFGINPREVRGDSGIFERIGTEVEHIGGDGVPA